jgi:hypothetical protein
LISVQLKGEIPKLKKDYVTYRSFKNFDHEKFLQEQQSEQLDVITEHSNVGKPLFINGARCVIYLLFFSGIFLSTTFMKVVSKL